MQINWKFLGRWAPMGIMLLGVGAGCGGFTGSHSISPATFLLPGLLKSSPPPPEVPAPQPEWTNMVAQLR